MRGITSSHAPRCFVLALLVVLFFGDQVPAQLSGHYIQGITGPDNGTGAPPGVYVAYLPYIYDIDSLRGPQGTTLLKPDLTLVAHNVAYQVTTTKKIFGADYGVAVIIPIVNTRLTANFLNTNVQQAGVSDIYFAPVVLGWAKGKATYLLNYGFYAPSGQFDPNASINSGLGFWEHQIQAGMGYSFDKKKLWNASALSTWEINQSKSGLDLTISTRSTWARRDTSITSSRLTQEAIALASEPLHWTDRLASGLSSSTRIRLSTSPLIFGTSTSSACRRRRKAMFM
jgi:hypothetical protein